MIARLAAAAAAALLAGAPAVAQTPEGGPWRLQRLYAPTTEVHEPFRFWLSAPDLSAADSQRPRVRMLMLNPDGGWSIIATEYRCGEGQARRIAARRFDPEGGQMHADTYDDAPYDLIPHIPEGLVYGAVCNGNGAGDIEATTIAAAREHEAADRARYLEAVAAAQAEAEAAPKPVADAPCRGNILRNPLFGIADPSPPADQPRPVTRTFNGVSQTLWGWQAASPGAPRWTTPESPGDGPLYLDAGESIMQTELRVEPGAWRLVIGAVRSGDGKAGIAGVVEGQEAVSFAFDAPDQPTLNVVELDLPAGVEQLTLTATGTGEVRLMAACLIPD